MKNRMLFLICLSVAGLAWLAPVLANGATYYVAKTGNNSRTCTQAQSVSTPKLTIAGGLACLAGGDALIIKAGTYVEAIATGQLTSGTSSAYTVIKAAPGETVIIRPTTGDPLTGSVVFGSAKHYLQFDGIVFDAARVKGSGLYFQTSSTNIRLWNIEVKNAPSNCVGMQGGTPRNLHVLNSWLHHCGRTTQEHGVYPRGTGHIIEHSEINNNSGHGIQFWASSNSIHNTITRYNYVHHNGSRGILIGSGNNNIAHDNLSTHNTEQGLTIGFASATNNEAYNNTSYANGSYCIDIRSGSSGSKVKNNLCLSNTKNTIMDLGSTSIITGNRLSTDLTLISGFSSNKYVASIASGLGILPTTPGTPANLKVSP